MVSHPCPRWCRWHQDLLFRTEVGRHGGLLSEWCFSLGLRWGVMVACCVNGFMCNHLSVVFSVAGTWARNSYGIQFICIHIIYVYTSFYICIRGVVETSRNKCKTGMCQCGKLLGNCRGSIHKSNFGLVIHTARKKHKLYNRSVSTHIEKNTKMHNLCVYIYLYMYQWCRRNIEEQM